jgi:hypothetical protein
VTNPVPPKTRARKWTIDAVLAAGMVALLAIAWTFFHR